MRGEKAAVAPADGADPRWVRDAVGDGALGDGDAVGDVLCPGGAPHQAL